MPETNVLPAPLSRESRTAPPPPAPPRSEGSPLGTTPRGETPPTTTEPPPTGERPERRTVTVVNRTADVEKRARELAIQQIRDKQNELKGVSFMRKLRPKNLWHAAKYKFGEDYYLQKGTENARKAMLANNNVYLDMDVIDNSVRDANRGRTEERAAGKAKVEQVGLGKQVEADRFQQVEDAQGPMKQLLVTEVLRPLVDGTATADDLQANLRSFVERHHNDNDPIIAEQVKRIFGSNATDFRRNAEYFATDLLEATEGIKQDIAAHHYALDAIAQNVDIKLANTAWAADTQVNMGRTDKAIGFLHQKSRGVLNATTMGAAASIGSFVLYKGAYRAVRAVGVGAGAGGIFRALERKRELKMDIASHKADTEYGMTYDTTSKGKLADMFDTRRKIEQRGRYQEIASVADMLHQDNDDRRTVGGDGRSLDTLMALDVNNINNRAALVTRVAEIQERLRFASTEESGFINFGEKFQVEQGRAALVKGIVEGKDMLIDAYVQDGMDRAAAEQQVNTLLQTDTQKWQERFTQDKQSQDKALRNYMVKSSLTHGVFGGAVGIAAALGIQQGIAWGGRAVGQEVKPTIIENAKDGRLSQPESQGHHIKDALDGMVEHPNQHVTVGGVEMHADKKGQIILDQINGKPLDSKVAPHFLYDDGKLQFQGSLKPDVAHQLNDAGFHVEKPDLPAGISDGTKKVDVPGHPHIQVELPKGTHLKAVGGSFELWTEDKKLIANQIKFDSQGQIVHSHVLQEYKSLVKFGEAGPGATTKIDTADWIKKHDTKVQVDWVEPTATQEGTWFRQSDTRAGKHAVRWDSTSMHHTVPPKEHVPKIIKDGMAFEKSNHDPKAEYPGLVRSFWPAGHSDQMILVKSPDGVTTLDQNSTKMLQVFDQKSGEWKPQQESVLAKMVFSKDLGDYKGGYSLTGHEDKMNMNVSTGRMIQENGKVTFKEFATDLSSGKIPDEVTNKSTVGKIEITAATTITVPDGWEAVPIVLPWSPRLAMKDMEQREVPPILEPEAEVPYYNYEGGNEYFRRADGTPATLADILHFKTPPLVEEGSPPIIGEFPAYASLASEIAEGESGKDALQAVHDTFVKTQHVYMVVSGAIGDAALTSTYIAGLRTYADKIAPGKKITLVIPPNVNPIIAPLAARYDCDIVFEERLKGVEKSRSLIQENNESDALVLEFDHWGKPGVEALPKGGLVVDNLLISSVGLYDQKRSGNEKFSAFLGDLLSIPEDERVSLKPQTELPAGHEQIFAELKQKYHIDESKKQVAVVVEASHKMKRYSLEQWKEVIEDIRQQQPDTEFNILYNPNPDSASYPEDELRSMFDTIPGARLVTGNLTEQIVLLGHQDVVIGNDTGFSHIGATLENGPQVISLHIPYFSPDIWVSNTQRHTGILPGQDVLTDSFDAETDDESRKWINRITPQEVSSRALTALTTPRPPQTGAEFVTSAADALRGTMTETARGMQRNQEKFDAAEKFWGVRLNSEQLNIITHGGTWVDLLTPVAKAQLGTDPTPEQLRAMFIATAQMRNSPLSEQELGDIFDSGTIVDVLQESVPLPEQKEQQQFSIKYQASSYQGHRNYNQDAYFTPDGAYLPEQSSLLDSTLQTQLSEEQRRRQADHLAGILNGIQFESVSGQTEFLQFSSSDILAINENIQHLLREGTLDGIAILADGMGGHSGGELASSISTLIAADYIAKHAASATDFEQLAKEATLQADRVVGALNRRNARTSPLLPSDMGTTLLITLSHEGETVGASVGDSRIYERDKSTGDVILRAQGGLLWSFLTHPSASGEPLKPSEYFTNPQRSHPGAAIQDGRLTEQSLSSFKTTLSKDKQLLLCTDGVWEGVDTQNPQVRSILDTIDGSYEANVAGGMSREEAAQIAYGEILKQVNLAGLSSEDALAEHLTRQSTRDASRDNTSAVIYDPVEKQGEALESRAPESVSGLSEAIAVAEKAAQATTPEEVKEATEAVDALMREIDDTISQRAIYGKFNSPNLRMHKIDEEIIMNQGQDFAVTPRSAYSWVHSIIDNVPLNVLPSKTALSSTFFFKETDPRNKDFSRVLISIPQNGSDTHGRPAHFAQIAFQMPTDKAEQLEKMIEKYPDAMERFYQVAVGLDNDDSQKALGRYNSSDVILIDKDKYNEACREVARQAKLKEVTRRKETISRLKDQIATEQRRYKGLSLWQKRKQKDTHESALKYLRGLREMAKREEQQYLYAADHLKSDDETNALKSHESEILTKIGAKRVEYKHGPYGKFDKPAAAA